MGQSWDGGQGEDALVRGGPADAEAIRALTHAAYARWVPVIGRLPLPMQADYAEAVRRHRFDLLRDGDTLAALIETAPGDGHLLIVNVAVHPARQGRGHGRLLLRHAEALAAAAGLPELRLYTNRLYAETLRLYARLGYRTTREEPYAGPDRTRDDDVMVHMTKVRDDGTDDRGSGGTGHRPCGSRAATSTASAEKASPTAQTPGQPTARKAREPA
ncbi:GNAT family N-acetyltransferase [Methylobacterium amylolyticum]|uniref:GNAT family N-acetyltransferase n=1 Tax=Methylobacterium sp. NEAU 140 TaxID=3064945 RepID=UPI00351FBD16